MYTNITAITAVLAATFTALGISCKYSDSSDFSQFLPMKESANGQLQGPCEKSGKHSP